MDAQAGDWREYSRLVLTELERHNDLLLKIHEKLDTIRLQQALSEQTTKDLVKAHESTVDRVDDLEVRVSGLESGQLVREELKKYKKYAISLVVIMFSSFIFPIIQIILKLRNYG